jgi:fructooligosaccharide transport system substrate-binding protein
MMRRVWIFLLIGLTLMSLALAACKASPPEPVVEATPMEAEQPAQEKEPVVLKMINIADELEAKARAEMIDAFHQIDGGKWSYVTVEYDAKPWAELFPSIERSVATGTEVDIIQADGPDVKHFAWAGVIQDLTDYYTEEELAIFAPQSISEGSYNGRFYGPPEVQSCQLMWYNPEMTDAAGIDMSSTEGWVFGENGNALENFQKLTIDADGDGTPEVYGLWYGGPGWYDYFMNNILRSAGTPGSCSYESMGPDGVTFSGYIDCDERIAAYKFMQDLIFKYKVQSVEPPTNPLLSGFVATQTYQDMIMGTAKDQFPDFVLRAIEPPYFQTKICQTGSWHYAISPNTKHFEEALAFVKFATSDEGAMFMWKYKNQLPANLNLLNVIPEFQEEGPRKLMGEFFQLWGKPRIETPAYTEYNVLFGEMYGALMTGDDASEVAKDYAQRMDDAASKYAGWNE